MNEPTFLEDKEVRSSFSFFDYEKDFIYLDSASTTQKLSTSIQEINNFYLKENTNIRRSFSKLDRRISNKIEKIRYELHLFLNLDSTERIVFTSGASQSMDKVVEMLFHNYLEDGDEIILSKEDHKSFTEPWFKYQELFAKLNKKIVIRANEIKANGQIDWEHLLTIIGPKTKVINLTHIHNFYGNTNTILYDAEKIAFLKEKNILINLDCTQSISKAKIDNHKIKADFIHFSGHKMFASFGVGGLVYSVKFKDIAEKNFEIGTPNISGILSLGPALDFINKIGIQKIDNILENNTYYLYKNIREIRNIYFTKGVANCLCKNGSGIISFGIKNVSTTELGQFLDYNNILIRSGLHCSGKENQEESVRISIHIYNTKEEMDYAIDQIRKFANSL